MGHGTCGASIMGISLSHYSDVNVGLSPLCIACTHTSGIVGWGRGGGIYRDDFAGFCLDSSSIGGCSCLGIFV